MATANKTRKVAKAKPLRKGRKIEARKPLKAKPPVSGTTFLTFNF
jgi:hypothetical protein